MLNAAIEQKATDGLNLRLSIACNTAVPFMPFSTGLSAHTAMLVGLSLCIGLDLALCVTLGSSIGYALYCQLHELIHGDPRLARRLITGLYSQGSIVTTCSITGPAGDEHNFGVLTTFWDRLFGTYSA